MVMETITRVIEKLGTADVDARLEELLVDGILYSFQEQTGDDGDVMLDGFGTVVNALGTRAKPYLPQICGTIKWRLNNKSAEVRQQAADLIARVASVMKTCEEEQLMGHLGVVLYEYLGEEYPEVLGSILGALKSIVNVTGMSKMTPPVKARSHFFTLVPIRPRSRGERRSLRTFILPGVCFSPPITPRWFQSRRASTPFNSASDAFELHPDVRSLV